MTVGMIPLWPPPMQANPRYRPGLFNRNRCALPPQPERAGCLPRLASAKDCPDCPAMKTVIQSPHCRRLQRGWNKEIWTIVAKQRPLRQRTCRKPQSRKPLLQARSL